MTDEYLDESRQCPGNGGGKKGNITREFENYDDEESEVFDLSSLCVYTFTQ